MTPKPRYVLPLNFRAEDKPLLDRIVLLAKKEDENLTAVIRTALNEFAERRCATLERGETHRIEEFCPPPFGAKPVFGDMLTPARLKRWQDDELLSAAKTIRARKQELDSELRRRGYYFSW